MSGSVGALALQVALQTETDAGVVELLAAVAPLLVVAILLVGLLWSAERVMPIAWIVALVVGFVIWENSATYLAASSIAGAITAINILYIVFGALVLLYTMMRAGAIERINKGFAAVSDDRRVQIVLLAFFMTTFIEGAAGFGTPPAVVAPLLLALGFPALAAVIAALIGHIIAVTYGAVGTPIVIGITDPLSSEQYAPIIAQDGGMEVTEFASQVAAWAATFHALVGFVMPLFAVGMVVYFFGEERTLEPVKSVVPLCLFAGFAFAIPYVTSAWLLTAEFPALIGSMVGGAATVGMLRAGYLQPDDEWDFPPQEEWPDHWIGTIQPGGEEMGRTGIDAEMGLLKAWSPYILLVVLLVLTRAVDPISSFITDANLGAAVGAGGAGEFVVGIVLAWNDILGTDLQNDFAWVNVPGFWLFISSFVAIAVFRLDGEEISSAWKEAGQKLVSPFIALTFVLMMVQVMLNSGGAPNAAFEVSMIDALAIQTAAVMGDGYPLISALIGALGAAMAGSNTVSNITFSGFQFTAAGQLGIPRTITVGAQAVGGAIGNLIAIHNVVAALATVGLIGQEGRVIRLNLIPLAYYATTVGILALVFTTVLFTGVF